MKRIYLFISRNRRKRLFRFMHRAVCFLIDALENKNNDQATNGEFWLIGKLGNAGAKVIFDVGANVGKWSLYAHEIFKSGMIYSFEPIPDTFERLKANITGKPTIRAYDIALSNEKGFLTFSYYPDKSIFSSIYHHYGYVDHRLEEPIQLRVQCMNGDFFCVENGVPTIDFLKLDVEGSEHLVLSGFKTMLLEKRIKVIQFEYGVFSIDSKFLLKDYYELFSGYDYKVGKIFPGHIEFKPYHPSMENFVCANYVAVSPNETRLINSLK